MESFDRVFEKHDEYSRFLSLSGERVSNKATEPSPYITTVKVKKALNKLTNEDFNLLYNKQLTLTAIKRIKENLIDKMEHIEYEFVKAINNLLYYGRSYDAIEYLKKAKIIRKNEI